MSLSTDQIDEDYFAFEYGDASADERLIDSQFISSTEYFSYNCCTGIWIKTFNI